jgi:tryptophan synthase alpha chain
MLPANRIKDLFTTKKNNILSIYFTAGYPNLEDTVLILQILQELKVDFVEIGIPFSDPIADGPVIQNCNQKAIENGMNLNTLLHQLQNVRQNIHIPIILMGYINPVLQFGIEKFCKKCYEIGIDGIILPDLPLYEYKTLYKKIFDACGISFINLITPQSSADRIREIDELTDTFLYLVSTAGTTGIRSEFSQPQLEYFKRVNSYNLRNPLMIGFGIYDRYSYETACKFAAGCIIGSAFLKAIENKTGEELINSIQNFIKQIR